MCDNEALYCSLTIATREPAIARKIRFYDKGNSDAINPNLDDDCFFHLEGFVQSRVKENSKMYKYRVRAYSGIYFTNCRWSGPI